MKVFWSVFAVGVLVLVYSTGALGRRESPKPQNHSCPTGKWQSKLIVHHIAVDQGDATFIRTPSGTTVLIDGGLPSKGRLDIVPTLKKCYELDALDYVVLTHFDQDHHGGLPKVLEAFKVNKALYDPGDRMMGKDKLEKALNKPNSVIAKYRKAAEATGKRKIPKLGERAIQDKDVEITLMSVNGKVFEGDNVQVFENGEPEDDNAVSISLLVRYGSFDYFIGGDLTGGGRGTPDVESEVAEEVGDVDMFHSNHHGSATSNNSYLLKLLEPEYVVISVGVGGLNKARYRLPDQQVMKLFDETKFIETIYQTSAGESKAPKADQSKVKNMDGDVLVVASKHRFKVNKEKYISTDGF